MKLKNPKSALPTALTDRVTGLVKSLTPKPGRPKSKWLMIVRETDLVFVSWPVPAATLRPLVAAGLEIDTFDGMAWITVEMLKVSLVRWRGLPPSPVPVQGPEMNVRTYVRFKDEPGIHFLSLDCPGLIGSALSRVLFKLPFHQATVAITLNGDNYHAESIRSTKGANPPAFAFSGRLQGDISPVADGTLDGFLLNQSVLFASGPKGDLHRGEVGHRRRVVQRMKGIVEINTLVGSLGIELPPTDPIVHYTAGDDALSWPVVCVKKADSGRRR